MTTADVVTEFIAKLESSGLRYAIGGSFASSFWGVARQTNDLDVVVDLEAHGTQEFLGLFDESWLVDPVGAERALASREPFASFQALHLEAAFKVDVFVFDKTAFGETALNRARRVELLPGLLASCTSPEDTTLQKLRWYELSNRVSDRQWNDVVQVIEVQGSHFDCDYFLAWAERLGLTQLAREALSEARSDFA